MVLDCLGCEQPPFSQGALHDFRRRLIAHEMDRRLLERTRELAKRTKAFDYKKLPKEIEVAVDSSPLLGAGRVEDIFNMLAHAAMKGIPLLAESSIKKALDIDWDDDAERNAALERLLGEIEALEAWVHQNFEKEASKPPRVKNGVAKDRRISIEDPDMRHGRKSKTKAFNGYKRHVAVDLDTKLVLAVALRPANEPEREALAELWDQLCEQGQRISAVYMDRGYIGSDVIVEILDAGAEVVCKPWAQPNQGRFTKVDFEFDLVYDQ